MDKNTVLAIVLSVVIVTAGFVVQNTFFPVEEPIIVEELNETVSTVTKEEKKVSNNDFSYESIKSNKKAVEKDLSFETDRFLIRFNTKGAVIKSLKLKNHFDGDKLVEMVYKGESEFSSFGISFSNLSNVLTDNFLYKDNFSKDGSIEFYQEFTVINKDGTVSDPFLLKKKYIFKDNEYLFDLEISLENTVNEYLTTGNSDIVYSLFIGPQIGPSFTKLDGRYSYRKFYTYDGENIDEIKIKNDPETVLDSINWIGLSGKYFSQIVIPETKQNSYIFTNDPIEGLSSSSVLTISRATFKSSKNTDRYSIYAGPRTKNELTKYNNSEKNKFGHSDLNLNKIIVSGKFLGWLENILKFILEFCYKLVPNYGIAIIMLTIFIKIVLFPFTHKSYESTSKMSAIQPKIKELQTKHKDDSQKLNMEMAALYKKEGVNPMGGCLPLLIQMPIFFALFGLLNKFFELRGAVFIPGWIMDLSSPESIFHLPFILPILNWTDIRLLPVLYVGSQVISMKFSGTSTAQMNSQTKMLTLGMPIMFFFILYNMPSGLLIYWIMTNLLTVGQQAAISKIKKGKDN